MKIPTTAFVVLAASGQALGSWVDWLVDPTVTATATRTIQYCPCNGEVRVTPVAPARGSASVEIFTKTGAPYNGAVDPGVGRTITRAGPIVVVYTTAGSMTTKTGIVIELKPTDGAKGSVTTKTIFTGPQPTDGLEWVDWDPEEDEEGGTLTRFHTKTETVVGPAPTSADYEPWADWVATSNEGKSSTTKKTTSSSRVGPIGGSTSTSSSSWTRSTSSTSSGAVGPIGGSTTSSWSSYSTSSSSSSSGEVGPIGGSTTSSSVTESTSTSTSTMSESTTTSSASSSIGPIGESTSSSSSVSESTSSSSSLGGPIGGSTTSTSAEVTTTVAPTTTTTVAVPTTTTSSGAPAVVTDDVRGLSYIDAILEAHNVHRRNHSAVDLTWSASLATIAGQTAASCVFAHDVTTGGGGYGQNIGAGYTSTQVAAMIGNDMYNKEMPLYPGPYDTNNVDTTNFNQWGHFSQIVWKSTQQVACATQYCPNGLVNAGFTQYFTVCNYYPPGNFAGQYANVGAPLGAPITIMQVQ